MTIIPFNEKKKSQLLVVGPLINPLQLFKLLKPSILIYTFQFYFSCLIICLTVATYIKCIYYFGSFICIKLQWHTQMSAKWNGHPVVLEAQAQLLLTDRQKKYIQ